MDEGLSRHERRKLANQQKEQQRQTKIISTASQRRKKKIRNYTIFGIIAMVIVIGSVYSLYTGSQKGSELITFAQCVSDKGAVMYGAFWCPHCQEQKNIFGQAFDEINYVECDERGKDAQPQLCDQLSITSYPTWIINDERQTSVLSLDRLSAITGCSVQ